MYNIVRRTKVIFFISVLLVAGSITSIAVFKLKLGLDFTGGTLQEISFSGVRPNVGDVAPVLQELGLKDPKLQLSGDHALLVRTAEVTQEQHEKIIPALSAKFGDVKEERFENIGPTIGKELKQKTLFAVLAVVAAILAYVAYAFRKVSEPASWVYGAGAVIALFHDLAITAGVFALLGHFKGVEVDTLFVTALLTTLGYSVNDTIVVFDRIRENRLRNRSANFETIVNTSINETMVRSLNTSLTTLIALSALLFFGGESIRYFVIALIVGIASGTYSSIFVASPVLLFWQQRRTRRAN